MQFKEKVQMFGHLSCNLIRLKWIKLVLNLTYLIEFEFQMFGRLNCNLIHLKWIKLTSNLII